MFHLKDTISLVFSRLGIKGNFISVLHKYIVNATSSPPLASHHPLYLLWLWLVVRAAGRAVWHHSHGFEQLTELTPCCCGCCWLLKWRLAVGAIPPDSPKGHLALIHPPRIQVWSQKRGNNKKEDKGRGREKQEYWLHSVQLQTYYNIYMNTNKFQMSFSFCLITGKSRLHFPWTKLFLSQ